MTRSPVSCRVVVYPELAPLRSLTIKRSVVAPVKLRVIVCRSNDVEMAENAKDDGAAIVTVHSDTGKLTSTFDESALVNEGWLDATTRIHPIIKAALTFFCNLFITAIVQIKSVM